MKRRDWNFKDYSKKIMGYRYPDDFMPIKPYGAIGDRKNDGYCQRTGVYHQVFAPEQPNARVTVVTAAKKAKNDFAGLKKAWDAATPIKKYRFVFNDEYMGCPPDVALICTDIALEHGIDASPFLAHHLEDEAMQLSPDQLFDVIQSPIPRTDLLPSVDYSVLREVVGHVMRNLVPVSREALLKAPDFTTKIEFNGLTASVGHLLHVAARQTEVIDDYFSKNSTFAKQELRDKLNGLYLHRRRIVNKKDPSELADLVFFDLLEAMIPSDFQQRDRKAEAQNAALVVIVYYFEACDVFETPDATA